MAQATPRPNSSDPPVWTGVEARDGQKSFRLQFEAQKYWRLRQLQDQFRQTMLCPATSLKQKEHLLARGVLQQNTTNQHQAATMSCSKPIQSISFAEIIRGRDSTIRVTHDHLIYAVDLVMVMTGLARDQSGLVLRRLSDETFSSTKMIKRQLSDRGGFKTKLVSFQDAIELIMVIPGKSAKLIRKHFKEIIVRYLDGDRSMCYEIVENQAMGKAKSYSNFASQIMNHVSKENALKMYSMPETCYVYATKSPAFPGMIKIGKTIDVANRLTQLNTSCAPAPHVIVTVAPTFNKDRDEKTAHAFFSSARREGEFFELEDAEVLAYFANHITAQYNSELAQNIARLQGLSM